MGSASHGGHKAGLSYFSNAERLPATEHQTSQGYISTSNHTPDQPWSCFPLQKTQYLIIYVCKGC